MSCQHYTWQDQWCLAVFLSYLPKKINWCSIDFICGWHFLQRVLKCLNPVVWNFSLKWNVLNIANVQCQAAGICPFVSVSFTQMLLMLPKNDIASAVCNTNPDKTFALTKYIFFFVCTQELEYSTSIKAVKVLCVGHI